MKKITQVILGVLLIAIISFLIYVILPVLNIKFLFNTIIFLFSLILLILIGYFSYKKEINKYVEKE